MGITGRLRAGSFDTALRWLPVLRTPGLRLSSGRRLMVSRASSVCAADGAMPVEAVRRRLHDFLPAFATCPAPAKTQPEETH